MTETTKRCKLSSTPYGPKLDAGHLQRLVSSFSFPAYAIIERFSGISFDKINKNEELPSGWQTAFAGRIFNEAQEFRWIADGSAFQAWTIKDDEDLQGPYEKVSRRYYLYGTWKDNKFSESTVHRANLNYPLQGTPSDHDRAYIDVLLYRQAMPLKWPEEETSIRDLLNQPAVAAHRFVTFAFGRDK